MSTVVNGKLDSCTRQEKDCWKVGNKGEMSCRRQNGDGGKHMSPQWDGVIYCSRRALPVSKRVQIWPASKNGGAIGCLEMNNMRVLLRLCMKDP